MKFSVIIATADRPGLLEKAVSAVQVALSRVEGGEIIVVDNGRNEATDEHRCTQIPEVKFLRSEPLNKAKALNAGIKAAQNEWLAFTDDDCLPEPDWLAEAGKYISSTGLEVFGGRVMPGPVGDDMPRWLKPGKSGRLPRGGAIVEYAPLPSTGILGDGLSVPFGANLFVCKDVFAKHGVYDEVLWERCGKAALGCEDAEFGMRLRARGEKIGYCAESIVVHPVYKARATIANHMRIAFRFAFRENVLFPGKKKASFLFLAQRMLVCLGRAVVCFIAGRSADVVVELMTISGAIGFIASSRIGCVNH